MTPRETPERLTPARLEQAIANLRDENRIFVSESDIGIVLAELDRLSAIREQIEALRLRYPNGIGGAAYNDAIDHVLALFPAGAGEPAQETK